MRRRVVPLVCSVLVLAGTMAACGEDREGSVKESGDSTATTGSTATGTTGTTATSTTPAPSGATVATVRVKETEYAIDPENPRVRRVGVVSFKVRNAGKVPHALEIEGPGGEVETEAIEPGKSATLKADLSKPGTYEWYCPIGDHKERGMKGKIAVAGGGSRTGTDDSGKDEGSDKRGSGSKKSDDPGKRSGAGGGNDGGVY